MSDDLELDPTGDAAALAEVLASLRGEPPAPGGLAPERLASLRAAFVAAGAAAIHRGLRPERWVELSLVLEPLEPAWVAWMTGELPPLLHAAVAEGRARALFFMNKPPGLRLRLLGPADALLTALAARLDALVADGVVRRWSAGVYDPEVALFGGPAGLELAHACFTVESLAVLAYHGARLRGEATLGPDEFSLALLHPLICGVADDSFEAWDVWCKLERTGRLPGGARLYPADPDVARALALRGAIGELLDDLDATLARASPVEAAALRGCLAALPAIGRRLRAAQADGGLVCGARELVPFWIVFHWNRMGFGLERQRQLARLMVVARHPRLDA